MELIEKWIYSVHAYYLKDHDDIASISNLQHSLSEKGEHGWELVGTNIREGKDCYKDCLIAIFKKRKQE